MGKSSILEIILFAIYDKFSRKGGIKDMINNRKNNFSVHVVLKIEDYEYHIVKSGTRTKKGTISQKLSFYRIKGNIKECLDEDTIKKTKNIIQKYFGCYNDIVNTNFSIQNDSNQFIDSENTARKKELERILNIDFIDNLYKKAQESFSKNKYILDHISTKVNPELGSKLAKDKITYLTELENIKNIKDKCESILNEKRDTLLKLTQQINSIDDTDNIDIDDLNKKLKLCVSNETELLLKLKNLKDETNLDTNKIDNLDKITSEIQNKTSEYNTTLKKYSIKIQKYNQLNLENTKKIRVVEIGDFISQLKISNNKLDKLNKEISILHQDIDKRNDIDEVILKCENEIKEQRLEHLKIQKETLPTSLNSLLKDNKSITLKKQFNNTEELLFDRLKIDGGDYTTFQEYKKHTKSSQVYYFHKELTTFNKNNGKQELSLKNSIENLELKLENLRKDKEELQRFKITLERKKQIIESLEKEISRLNRIINTNAENIEYNKKIQTDIAKNETSLKKYNDAKESLESKYNNDNNYLNKLLTTVNYRDKINSLANKIKLINNDINKYNKNIEVIEANKKLNQDIEIITNDINQLETKHKEIELSYNKANANISQTMSKIKQFKIDNQKEKILKRTQFFV